jgi:hypothetical protein
MGNADNPETQSSAAILEAGWTGSHTAPVPGTFPHQWYKDSTIAAVGQSHVHPERAVVEITSLFRGQWPNGMFPHQINKPSRLKIPLSGKAISDVDIWNNDNPLMPPGVKTSGITQPLILADGLWTIAKHLSSDDRTALLKEAIPRIGRSHDWVYDHRDFSGEGLASTIHPFESGVNYISYWIELLEQNPQLQFQRAVGHLPVERMVKLLRSDMVNEEGQVSLSVRAGILTTLVTRDLSKLGYDPDRIRDEWPYKVEDVIFNAALIRNNQILLEMAEETGIQLSSDPDKLKENMARTERAFEQLYVPDDPNNPNGPGNYYSRVAGGKHLKTLTIASMLAIYSGIVPRRRADYIEAQLQNETLFGPPYPIPTLPTNDPNFNPRVQSGGATDPILNWLEVKGLEHVGKTDTARAIARTTIELAEDHGGSYGKHYSSITGEPNDKNQASTTAAVAKDVITIANAQLFLLSAVRRVRRKHKKTA